MFALWIYASLMYSSFKFKVICFYGSGITGLVPMLVIDSLATIVTFCVLLFHLKGVITEAILIYLSCYTSICNKFSWSVGRLFREITPYSQDLILRRKVTQQFRVGKRLCLINPSLNCWRWMEFIIVKCGNWYNMQNENGLKCHH